MYVVFEISWPHVFGEAWWETKYSHLEHRGEIWPPGMYLEEVRT